MSKDLIILDEKTVKEAFRTGEGLDGLVKQVEEQVEGFEIDLTTAGGRALIASNANKVTKFKVRAEKIAQEVTKSLRGEIAAINKNCATLVGNLAELKDEARKPLTDWENEIKAIREDSVKAASKAVGEHYEFTKATSHELIHSHIARPAVANVLTSSVAKLTSKDEIQAACKDIIITTNKQVSEQAQEFSEKLNIIQEEAGEYFSRINNIPEIFGYVPGHIRYYVRDLVSGFKSEDEAQQSVQAQQQPIEPPPALEPVSVEQQFEQHFVSGEVTQGPANPPVINPIESRIARHLFDHHGVTQAQARAIAKALINNEIPGINVAANQSVA